MPITPYNLNIPAANNAPSDDQPNMLVNTNSISSLIDKDHFTFSETNSGWHRKSTYIAGSAPGSASDQIVEYGKTSSGSTELFIQRDGVGTEIQLTRGNPSVSANGYTFLPGGLLLQWGSVNATQSGVTFSFPISFTSSVYSVTLGIRSSGSSAVPSCATPSLSGVAIYTEFGTSVVYVMAIGV